MIARILGTLLVVVIVAAVVVLMVFGVLWLWDWSVVLMGMPVTVVVWLLAFACLSWQAATHLGRRIRE